MRRKSILSLLLMGLALLASVSQVFAGAAPQTGQATETPTPTARVNPATMIANQNATKQAAKLDGPREHYKGRVSASDPTSLTLFLNDGSSLTIGLDPRTRILFGGPKGSRSGGIRPGDTVMAQTVRDSEQNFVALTILVLPGKPTRSHHIGVVTEYKPGVSVTIQDTAGFTRAFTLNAATQIMPSERAPLLAAGMSVTVIAQRDPTSGAIVAIGIVVQTAAP